MAQRLNKKVIVGLTTVGMAVTTAAGVVMILNLPKKDPQQFVQQAEKYEADKDYKNATLYYLRAYQRATTAGIDTHTSNDYMTRAGDMALKTGDARKALNCWRQVILNDPRNTKAQEEIVRFYLELAEMQGADMWAQVQTSAEKLTQAGGDSNSKNFYGLYALGRALIARKAVKESYGEEGKKHLIEAVNGDKGNPDYAKALADCYLSQGEIKDAVSVYDILMANVPPKSEKEPKAYLFRGQFYVAKKVSEKIPDADQRALADLTKAVELAPTDVDCQVGLGAYWHNKKQESITAKASAAEIENFRGKAKQNYENAIKADPDHYAGYLQLIQLYFDDQKYDDALKVVSARLERPTNREHYLGWRNKQYKAIMLNAAFRINLSKLTEIGKIVKSEDEYKKEMQAILDRLTELHKDMVAEMGEDEPMALFMQGRLLLLKGDLYGAIKAIEKAEKLTPGMNLEFQRLLADLYVRTGSPGLAEESIRMVLSQLPNDAGSWALLASVMGELHRPEDELAAAERALAIDSKNEIAFRAKMQAYEQQKNFEGLKELQKLLGTRQNAAGDKLNRALITRLQATQGDSVDKVKLAEVEKLLREVLDTEPYNLTALRNLIGVLGETTEGRTKSLAIVATARAAADKKLAEITATQPTGDAKTGMERVIKNLDLLKVVADPNVSEEDRVRHMEEVIKHGEDPYTVALDLFQLYQQREDRVDDAFKVLKDAYKLRPNEASVMDALFMFALAKKDWPLAEELMDKTIALGYERSGGHITRGQLILAKSVKPEDAAGAVTEFQQALAEFPSFAEGHALLGRALFTMNKLDEAKQSFLEARRLNPSHAWATVGLAMIATVQHDDAEREKYLALCEQVAPNHPWARSQIQDREDKKDPKKGIARREALRKKSPKDIENLRKLAGLYNGDKNNDQAKAIYEECLKMAPKDLDVAHDYAVYLATKEPPEIPAAREFLKRLVQSFTAEENAQKTQAQLLLARHMKNEAPMQRPDSPKPEEVDAAYVAAAGISDAPETYMEIADFFMETGRNGKAEEWFRKVLALPNDKVHKELRLRAHQYLIQVLVRAMDQTRINDLQKEINVYREHYPEDAYGLLFQAEHDVANGQDNEAMKNYTEFLNKQPNSINGYYRRGLAHYRRSEWDLAAKDLAQVKRLSPSYSPVPTNRYQPRSSLAQALLNSGQIDAAIAEMQSILNEPGYPLYTIQNLFTLYLQLKRYDGADSLIETRSKSNPNLLIWDQLRMQLALARKDSATAIKIAEATAERNQLTPQAVDLLFQIYLDTDHYDNLIRFVEQKIPPDKRTASMMLRLASAYAGKKDAAKALDVYAQAFNAADIKLDMFSQVVQTDLRKRLDLDAALQVASTQVQSHPDDHAYKIMLSMIQNRKGDPESASKTLKDLLGKTDTKKTEEYLFYLRELSTQLYALKKYDESRDSYLKILAMQPNDAYSLNNLAYLLMEDQKNPQEAIKYAKKAAEVLPNNAGILDTLGWNWILLNDYNQGIVQLGKAVEADSRLAAVHYHLAEALVRRSRTPNAVNKEMDLEQAKAEIQLTQKLVVEAGEDPDHLLEKITVLAEQLGIKLEKTPEATPATKPTVN